MTQSKCQNCGTVFNDNVLVNPIPDIEQRVSPGEIMPSGECPYCGAVCHSLDGTIFKTSFMLGDVVRMDRPKNKYWPELHTTFTIGQIRATTTEEGKYLIECRAYESTGARRRGTWHATGFCTLIRRKGEQA